MSSKSQLLLGLTPFLLVILLPICVQGQVPGGLFNPGPEDADEIAQGKTLIINEMKTDYQKNCYEVNIDFITVSVKKQIVSGSMYYFTYKARITYINNGKCVGNLTSLTNEKSCEARVVYDRNSKTPNFPQGYEPKCT